MSSERVLHERDRQHGKHHEHEPWRAGWQERHVGMAVLKHSKALPHRYHSIARALRRLKPQEATWV
jgi:hypothetical protein